MKRNFLLIIFFIFKSVFSLEEDHLKNDFQNSVSLKITGDVEIMGLPVHLNHLSLSDINNIKNIPRLNDYFVNVKFNNMCNFR